MLLVQAFVDEVVDKVADEALRDEIKAKAEEWLHVALG